jgi:hypothetical protein
MEYFTIMWITVLGGTLDGSTSGLLYMSLDKCNASTSIVSRTLEYDHSIKCEETAVASSSIRPKPRPEGLADG